MRVMIVDDHFVVRSGLVASLEMEEGITVVAEAEDGESALELFREEVPDVVLMDLQLPGWNGIETTERLLEVVPRARVLIFSTFARDDEIQAALAAGALGYLQKTASRDELIGALRRVAEGKAFLAPGLAARIAGLKIGPIVTLREREILSLVAKGKANKEIAAELGIAEDTVKRHVSNVLQKLEVSDRAQATAEAIRRGIIKVDS
ncbi:MAG: response regulator transcription factor [Verrucomicrobiales bacterium]|nr:response regulator transcription factor [Verrucomicrobiales bacterium]MBP9225721.1 response regulator transcription factor [Verrucomicrobiales bacterium]